MLGWPGYNNYTKMRVDFFSFQRRMYLSMFEEFGKIKSRH